MPKAIQLDRKDGEKNVTARVVDISPADLPDEGVLVAVEHSTLNYKDGLVLNGLGNLVRSYPHVPGIDFAGTVLESDDPRYAVGDKVVLTGWRVGESYWGGYSGLARVPADFLVPLPKGLTTRQAMAVGTAGLTAMLGILALEDTGLKPDAEAPVLVTGAAGGVGSVATALLARAGYTVDASTGRESLHEYLHGLGATTIVPRSELDTPNGKPLNRERWAGCIDSVGGSTLANVLTQLCSRGAVASIGLAGGSQLDTTVIPFLLRGVSLLGIDSVTAPFERRQQAWKRIAQDLPMDQLEGMTREVGLEEVIELGKDILDGKVQGRVVVTP